MSVDDLAGKIAELGVAALGPLTEHADEVAKHVGLTELMPEQRA